MLVSDILLAGGHTYIVICRKSHTAIANYKIASDTNVSYIHSIILSYSTGKT